MCCIWCVFIWGWMYTLCVVYTVHWHRPTLHWECKNILRERYVLPACHDPSNIHAFLELPFASKQFLFFSVVVVEIFTPLLPISLSVSLILKSMRHMYLYVCATACAQHAGNVNHYKRNDIAGTHITVQCKAKQKPILMLKLLEFATGLEILQSSIIKCSPALKYSFKLNIFNLHSIHP